MKHPDAKPRPIFEIAADIRKAWPKPYFGAVPYLQAMGAVSKISDRYGMDSAVSVVSYFLANASTFRGAEARALKGELQQHLKGAR